MQRCIRFVALGLVAGVLAWAAFPRVMSVEPEVVQAGDEATASGSALDGVVKLYLTAAGKDTPVETRDRTPDSIRFVVPADLAMGSYKLTIETGPPSASILEQPVHLEVGDAAAVEKYHKELTEAGAPIVETAGPAEPPQ